MSLRLGFIIAATAAGGSFQFYSYSVVNNAQTTLIRWIRQSFAERGIGISQSLVHGGALKLTN